MNADDTTALLVFRMSMLSDLFSACIPQDARLRHLLSKPGGPN
jgi:hypothetical protein